jgi:hypothetical protein
VWGSLEESNLLSFVLGLCVVDCGEHVVAQALHALAEAAEGF